MLAKLRSHRPSPAMAVASVALFVALGGTSYAVATGSIDSREIKDSTILSKDIQNNSVHGKDVRNSTVSSGDVASNSLIGGDVRENSLSGSDIAPNAVSGDELQANAVSADEIQPNSIDGDELKDGGVRAADLSEALFNPVVRVSKETVPNNTTITELATCPPGERAIAGGYGTVEDLQTGVTAISNGPAAFVSGSDTVGGIATTWRVRVRNTTGSSLELTVFATCVQR